MNRVISSLSAKERKQLVIKHYNLVKFLKANGVKCQAHGSSIWVQADKPLMFCWFKDTMFGRFNANINTGWLVGSYFHVTFTFHVDGRKDVLAKVLKHCLYL